MTKMKVRVVDAYVYRKTIEGIEFLILKRAKTKIYEHLWQGVAGKIEEGENIGLFGDVSFTGTVTVAGEMVVV